MVMFRRRSTAAKYIYLGPHPFLACSGCLPLASYLGPCLIGNTILARVPLPLAGKIIGLVHTARDARIFPTRPRSTWPVRSWMTTAHYDW